MLEQTAFLHLLVTLTSFSGRPGFAVGFMEALREKVVLRKLARGTVLLERGKRQQVVWFVHSGTVKELSASGDGGERVSWFWFASDFVFSFPGFFAQEPALSSMELVEDSVLLELSFAGLMELKEEFGELGLLVEKIRSRAERERALHAGDLVGLSARERFRKFFGLHKGLFNVARHKDIASFLGIRDDGFHRYW